jgi:hypothetical protein
MENSKLRSWLTSQNLDESKVAAITSSFEKNLKEVITGFSLDDLETIGQEQLAKNLV